ncbi:MAG: hypothetical protein Q9164_005254 [Protoblastenia rupestris]
MEHDDQLRGECSCGRNHYLILLQSNPLRSLQVLYDDAAEHSKLLSEHQAASRLTKGSVTGRGLSLRVPLTTIRSTTHAFYPDETHGSIRRVFTPAHAPLTKRHFCGFCGTPLSSWSEESPEEAEFVRINMGSLKSESLERLQDAGLLDTTDDDQDVTERSTTSKTVAKRTSKEVKGNPWFEEMIEGSDLGRIKRRRGGQTSSNGNTTVEWEIVEIGGEDDGGTGIGTAKRKLGEVGEGDDDAEMRG